tara:strand:- start:144 stop:545 length:402 start_codon:yes stop_codon:yes gene_type:complete
MNQKLIKYGFTVAALMNFSVIIFSRGFTNVAINDADPVVMSNFGLLMIVIWGLAYLAVAGVTANIKWLVATFALEKLIYAVIWLIWLSKNSLAEVYSTDIFAGIFYSIYGVNDLLFMLFFSYVFFTDNENVNS